MNSRIDPDNPGTWLPYNKSNCSQCSAVCCTQEVEVTLDDLVTLELISSQEVEYLDTDEIFANLKANGFVSKWSRKTGKFSLLRRNGRDCLFLNSERKCSVYSKRPKTCREYPYPSSRPGFCPFKKK